MSATTRAGSSGGLAAAPDRGDNRHRERGGGCEPFEYSFGAVPYGDSAVRFQLWAPDIPQVMLELDASATHVMQARPDGFHECVVRCMPGARYRYGIGSGLWVPDPASRLQAGDVNDASIVVDSGAYDWRHPCWQGRPWSETVLYEIHCGLAGGFTAVCQRLPELARLGITAIELMPVADFPGSRNWGYDGVLPYAPDCAYGTPDELRQLIDSAHGHGISVLLDVVYNHFGPQGNYLSSYASEFFRTDIKTPWGQAIDFRRAAVRAFFAENALYWLREYRFDGLRLDAVHAIAERDWLVELAAFLRGAVDPARQVHLVLENDDNAASLLRSGFDAQWNDDAHHVMHVALTGETQGYYSAYTRDPAKAMARFLAQGFVYQGEPSPLREGRARGEPSADLPPTSFVFFLQNHDQIGNRAFGERLISLCGADSPALHAAVALQILTPHIPLLFMGEECASDAPFQYFTSYDDPGLASAVREGRRAEFAAFPAFSEARARERIPDPNRIDTWQRSQGQGNTSGEQAGRWREWYRALLAIRQTVITPHLAGARSDGARVLGRLAVHAQWILGNGARLELYCNLDKQACACPPLSQSATRILVFASNHDGAKTMQAGRLDANSLVAVLDTAATTATEKRTHVDG